MRKFKKFCAVLVIALIMTTVFPEPIALIMNLQTVEAATIKMSKSKASLNIGKSLGLKVTGTTKNQNGLLLIKMLLQLQKVGKLLRIKKGLQQSGHKSELKNIVAKSLLKNKLYPVFLKKSLLSRQMVLTGQK